MLVWLEMAKVAKRKNQFVAFIPHFKVLNLFINRALKCLPSGTCLSPTVSRLFAKSTDSSLSNCTIWLLCTGMKRSLSNSSRIFFKDIFRTQRLPFA